MFCTSGMLPPLHVIHISKLGTLLLKHGGFVIVGSVDGTITIWGMCEF